MNWVGGVKRRIVMQEDEDRRQQQFFAKQIASVPQKRLQETFDINLNVSRIHRKREVAPMKRSVISSSRPLDSTVKNESTALMEECESPNQCITRQGIRINRRLKLSSIHSSYSEMLMKQEMEGIKHKKKQQQALLRQKLNIANTIASYSTSKDCDDKLQSKKPETSVETPLNRHQSYPNVSPSSKTNKSGLLKGAPKTRRILTLSPKILRGKKIWTALKNESSKLLKNVTTTIPSSEDHKEANNSKNKTNLNDFHQLPKSIDDKRNDPLNCHTSNILLKTEKRDLVDGTLVKRKLSSSANHLKLNDRIHSLPDANDVGPTVLGKLKLRKIHYSDSSGPKAERKDQSCKTKLNLNDFQRCITDRNGSGQATNEPKAPKSNAAINVIMK